MSINEVSNLTYSQYYTLMTCLRESNKAASNENAKAQAMMRLVGGNRG